MLWDQATDVKDGEEKDENVSVTPILVPLQSKSTSNEKTVPVLVPDVRDLKDQFQQQQNMLTQIKETLKRNESQLTSKEKQVEVYATKLSQIKARSKNTSGKKTISTDNINPARKSKSPAKTSSNENLSEKLEIAEPEIDKSTENNSKIGRRGKVSELKKRLEENKIKFEQRTGKEQKETKKIESLVEQLKTKLEERDKTIQDLQKNIDQRSQRASLPRRTKEKDSVASKTTQTNQTQASEESIELVSLQNKIYELEATILDLEENLREKESVIKARTQAVTLLSQDLSLKGKNTLDNLEETRQEMRTMQSHFVTVEDKLKKDLSERDNRLADLEEKYKSMRSINFDLSVKNAELQEKLVNFQGKNAELEEKLISLQERNGKSEVEIDSANRGEADEKLEELQKKISFLTKELDHQNKSMIKMKIESKNKIKNLNKLVETLKETSDEKGEIVKLSRKIEELENVKTGLENRLAELEDEKASEKKLKEKINDLETMIKKQSEDLSLRMGTIANLEKENSNLIRSNQEQNLVIENLYAKMLGLSSLNEEEEEEEKEQSNDVSSRKLSRKLAEMESEYNRKLEELKVEHGKEMDMLESYYAGKVDKTDKKELEEYRISTEISNIHVEEQIELLIREKQQLLEKLKSLSGISLTDSLAFEKLERPEMREVKDVGSQLCEEEIDSIPEEEDKNGILHLQKIVSDQQRLITDLQKTIQGEKENASAYEKEIKEMEETIRRLEEEKIFVGEKVNFSDVGESGQIQKSNFNTRNEIKKIEIELSVAKRTLEEQTEKINDLSEKLEEKEDLIRKYTAKIELFEKDDWDRQNHWENPEGDIENVQELQKKCLGLENALIELTEQCERLRKENIEVVHLLSLEKVKKKKLLEESVGNRPKFLDGQTQSDESYFGSCEVEKKIFSLNELIVDLEGKMDKLETSLSNRFAEEVDGGMRRRSEEEKEEKQNWKLIELEEKLEWTNVVLTSKETEIFRLQNLSEDRFRAIEDLNSDLSECKANLVEKEKTIRHLTDEIESEKLRLKEMTFNFNALQVSINDANEKLERNESKLKDSFDVIKAMEENSIKKDSEIREMNGILNERNRDLVNLEKHIEELRRHFSINVEKMQKLLKEKESDSEALSIEKNRLEEAIKNLIAEKDDFKREKTEFLNEKEKLIRSISEMENSLRESNEKLKEMEKSRDEKKSSGQEIEEMKTKMKKLAANLKKKVQVEGGLLERIKELENVVGENEKTVEKYKSDLNEVTEKWSLEKSEKELIQNELIAVSSLKGTLEKENGSLREKCLDLEKELESSRLMHEGQVKMLEDEIQRTYKTCNELQIVEEEYKNKLFDSEKKLNDISRLYQISIETARENEMASQREREEKESLSREVNALNENLDKLKSERDQIVADKKEIEIEMEDLKRFREVSTGEKTGFDAKMQENLAVIENLESELARVQDRVKYVEEKLFVSEESRFVLEKKNEEMERRIADDSGKLARIEDLENRIEELLKTEKELSNLAKSLESINSDLKLALNESNSAKKNSDEEVKSMTEKVRELAEELRKQKDLVAAKNSDIDSLGKEMEKIKSENRQISAEFDRLNRDYDQFENDFRENLENSQNLEKSLRHRIDELSNENSSLLERLNLLSEDKFRDEDKPDVEECKKPKKRKSVTFRTDEVEYIKELKGKLHQYDSDLKEANREVENLKAELFKERLKGEVSDVLAEARSKAEMLKSASGKPEVEPSPESEKRNEEERKFDANLFFGGEPDVLRGTSRFFDEAVKGRGDESSQESSQPSELDSLQWDDSWGTDGHLEEEYMSARIVASGEKPANQYEGKMREMEEEIDSLKKEVERKTKELQELNAKHVKAVKKLKEQKSISDRVQAEMEKLKNRDGFDDLNAAIVDELKSQIENMEKKEKELTRSLEKQKSEKEALLKRIDVLSAGNEKFLEMKERQDADAEFWQQKNNQLLMEISTLRQKLEESRGMADESEAAKEKRELLNKIEGLEWKICELTEERNGFESGDKTEVVEELKRAIEDLEGKLSDEVKRNSTAVTELEGQVAALAEENETLQNVLGEMKMAARTKKSEEESIVADLNGRIRELETLLKVKEEEIGEVRDLNFELRTELDNGQRRSGKDADSNSCRRVMFEMGNDFRPEEGEIVERKNVAESGCGIEFETIDLNRGGETSCDSENWKITEEDLKGKIAELENLLLAKEESLNALQSTFVHGAMSEEMQDLKQRNFQLEEFLRLKEDELNRLRSLTWNQNVEEANEIEGQRRKIADMEELLRFKENELYEVEAAKVGEIQNLNVRIFDLENVVKARDVQQENFQQRIFQLENLLRTNGNESRKMISENANEVENFRTKVAEMENLVAAKNEEIERLVTRLNELEKSYNDSKIEIERLLNEENLNSEEKFVEPFQKNIQIPIAYELEAISRSLVEEKEKANNLQYELTEKDKLIERKTEENRDLNERIVDLENRLTESTGEKFREVKAGLENSIIDLRGKLENVSRELNETRSELDDCRKEADETVENLKFRLAETEAEMARLTERKESEIAELKSAQEEKVKFFESLLRAKSDVEEGTRERSEDVVRVGKSESEREVEMLRSESTAREEEISNLRRLLNEERSRSSMEKDRAKGALEEKEREAIELKQALMQLQDEMGHFRNFEKQVKELRLSQLKQEGGTDLPVTPEGDPDLSHWNEHELAELSTRLQSDLDTALYMLHQRDVRCDELTFELMQLIEERDTLQLRLSTAMRMNEELKEFGRGNRSGSSSRNKDLLDQSNDRQEDKDGSRNEDLRQLASKISELHSISYLRDKTVKDDSVQRHTEQMNLLSRISDSDASLSKDVQTSPTVVNWMRSRTTPKVMHI